MQGYLAALITLWALTTGLGLIAFPLVAFACRPLVDRGFAASKLVALVLTGYGAWLASSLKIAPFGRASILFVICLIGVFSAVVVLRRRSELLALLAGRARAIAATEAAFFVFFACLLLLVGSYSSITPSSEGLMDIGILNSVVKTSYFPAKDVWLAGHSMNYYYFGHVLVGTLCKLCGLSPVWIYTPAKALVFSLFWLLVLSLGWSITGLARYGAVAVFFVCLGGNLDALRQLLSFQNPVFLDWFASSRVIPHTINEFPFFSLLWGDLHAYVLAFPVFALCLTLAFCLHRSLAQGQGVRRRGGILGLSAMLALGAGAALSTNAWDFVSIVLVLVLVLGFGLKVRGQVVAEIRKRALLLLFALAGALLLFLPFILSVSQRRPVCLVKRRTGIADFLIVFGILLAPIVFELITTAAGSVLGRQSVRRKEAWMVFTLVGVCLFWAMGMPVWALMASLLVAVLFVGLPGLQGLASRLRIPAWDRPNWGMSFWRLLVVAGALLAIGCEVFFLKDIYGQRYERMNTVFKLYLHIWTFWGLGAACAVFGVRRRLWPHIGRGGRRFFYAMLCFCLAAGAIYPVFAPVSRTGGFAQGWALACDGLFKARYPADARASEWLFLHVGGQKTIAEAPASGYDWGGRVSSFTGHCAVVGWYGHEAGWRNEFDEPYTRAFEVEQLYNTSSLKQAEEIIRKYGIELVVVGQLERSRYRSEGLSKFEGVFRAIYDAEGVRVYDVSGLTVWPGRVKG